MKKIILDYFKFDEPIDYETSVVSIKDNAPQWFKDAISDIHELISGEIGEHDPWMLKTCLLAVNDFLSNNGGSNSRTYASHVKDNNLDTLIDWENKYKNYALFKKAYNDAITYYTNDTFEKKLRQIQYCFARNIGFHIPSTEEGYKSMKATKKEDLMYDISITYQDSLLDKTTKNKIAAGLLLQKDGLILAVSRKDDHEAFGLPGGKVDPGEDIENALIREVKEEVGLTVSNPVELFGTIDQGKYLWVVYSADVSGDIHTEEPHAIKWVEPKVLLEGPFKESIKEMFDELKITY